MMTTQTTIFGVTPVVDNNNIVFPAGYYSQWQSGDTVNMNFQGNDDSGDFVYWNDRWSVPVKDVHHYDGNNSYTFPND